MHKLLFTTLNSINIWLFFVLFFLRYKNRLNFSLSFFLLLFFWYQTLNFQTFKFLLLSCRKNFFFFLSQTFPSHQKLIKIFLQTKNWYAKLNSSFRRQNVFYGRRKVTLWFFFFNLSINSFFSAPKYYFNANQMKIWMKMNLNVHIARESAHVWWVWTERQSKKAKREICYMRARRRELWALSLSLWWERKIVG